ncbi:uncharacterized protein LOC131953042 isoform X2 [Physella acuta]|uniref:uncharacterized protein LOC131953042 isoform X2 n=1 Tax=Physella acuta TaxID=109671 RepID=UPI0027DDC866|nr:uncharacterized protein LOC131953042 isoform X2 [Physella acuta]
MVNIGRPTINALEVHGLVQIRLSQETNGSWVGYIDNSIKTKDDVGALYYVVAVIFIYGLSIVMMIASHIRKNKQDNQLRTYLKEMANLRKSDRREKVLSKMNDLANRRKNQEAIEAKQKLEEKLKDIGDNETDKMAATARKKDPAEDNTDSVFLPADFCIPPLQGKPADSDRLSDNSSYRNLSISSRGSVRNSSTGSFAPSNVPSNVNSPSETRPSPTERTGPKRVRSPNFHDYRRWKRADNRVLNIPECKTVRIQEDRLSPCDQRSTPPDSPSSTSEYRTSGRKWRERSPTSHDARPSKWSKQNNLHPNRGHRLSDGKVNELKQSFPASFHIVNEDAVL